MTRIVVGIDGGGTVTRLAAADLSGRVLAVARSGAASPNKTTRGEENVREGIADLLARAGARPGDVAALVAGFAGLDAPSDQEWAARYTALPGLACPRLHVNDAVVAHAGAFGTGPGIIVVGGTGAIVFGITEAGRHLRNYDFHHYAPVAARLLAYDWMYRYLAGDAGPGDEPLAAQVRAFWQVATVEELRERGASGFHTDRFERNRLFGEMAPLITEAALQGALLARAVCDTACDALGVSLRLLGPFFSGETVPVALIGSAIRSPYLRQSTARVLGSSTRPRFAITEPTFASELGAAQMALAQCGVPVDAALHETMLASIAGMIGV